MKSVKKIKERKISPRKKNLRLSCYPKNPKGIILYVDYDNIEKVYNKALAIKKFTSKNDELYDKINDTTHNTNLEHMSLILSTLIDYPITINDFLEKIKNINSHTKDIYPGMPIKLCGYIKNFINKNTLKIYYNDIDKFFNITLKKPNKMIKDKNFIYDRFIFIIGEVERLDEKPTINVSAILC